MLFTDTLTLDASTRRTADGYMVASVRAARTGVQTYRGSEVGRPDLREVRVFRPEAEVFSADSLNSYAHRPVTIEHPRVPVSASTWRDVAVGTTGDRVVRDGEFVRVDLAIMDADAIAAVEGGKRQISQGYDCELVWQDGITPDGLPYEAVQTNIRANHTAIVGLARGGPQLKIGDSQVTTRAVLIDGHSVNLEDAAAILVDGLQKRLAAQDTELTTLRTNAGALTAQISTKDGEIAVLKAQVADAALTPAKLDAAVAARQLVVDAATKLVPNFDAKGKSEAEIRRAVVTAKLGDATVKTLTEDGINGAFSALAVQVKDSDPIRTAIQTQAANPAQLADAEQAMEDSWDKANTDLNSWRTAATA